MKLINKSVWKFKSVQWSAWVTILISAVLLILQNALDLKLLPEPWDSIASMAIVLITAIVGKKVYQPELHAPSNIQGFISTTATKDVVLNGAGYKHLREHLFPILKQSHIDNIEIILIACHTWGVLNLQQISYILATTYHETGHTMQPIEEIGKGKGRKYAAKVDIDGTVYKNLDHIYYGRGYVQLTWLSNYVKMRLKIGVDFVNKPELTMVPEFASQILVVGMRDGDFTGKKLSHYINDKVCDYKNARRIINGTDRKDLIAGYAKIFEQALLKSKA